MEQEITEQFRTTKVSKVPRKKQNQRQFLLKSVQLMVCHVPESWDAETEQIKTSLFGSPLHSVSFGGTVSVINLIDFGSGNSKGKLGLYTIDDGTGKIVVQYQHLSYNTKEWSKGLSILQQKVDIHKTEGLVVRTVSYPPESSETKQLLSDLSTILNVVDVRLRRTCTYLKTGEQVVVTGVPILYQGELRIKASSIDVLTKRQEMNWKLNIIKTYKKYIKHGAIK